MRKPKVRNEPRPIVIERIPGMYTALGYRSARVATGEGRTYQSYPGSSHDERDRKKLIAQSRDFRRNNPIYTGMIDRAVGYIVGNGFQLQVNTGSAAVDAKIETLWKDWFRRPEIRSLLSGPEVSRMICREVMVAGDTIALLTDKSLIQLFEAEQLEGNKKPFTNGIQKDDLGRPVKFKICPWKKHSVDIAGGKEVKAANVLFVTNSDRPSQIRGVPVCQSSFAMLHRINDTCDSEAIAQQLLARLAVSITREDATALAPGESIPDPNKSPEELEGDLATRLTELDYALIFHANPNEKIAGIDHNIPGKNFSESLRMFLRLLGLPLGLPLELILLDWTKSNYSQSRAVLQQAFQGFTAWQEKMETFFYTPVFNWKLRQWQTQKLIGKREIKFEWIKATWPWIDQLKEAQAYSTQVERGFITHGQVCKSLNTDRSEVVTRREAEVRDAIERVKKIEAETGVKVPWQIFAGLKPPTDKKMLAKPADKEKDEEEEEEE